MITTPWGNLRVIDAHTHFFSHEFFRTFARLAKDNLPADAPLVLCRPEIPGAAMGGGDGHIWH